MSTVILMDRGELLLLSKKKSKIRKNEKNIDNRTEIL